MDDFAFMVTDAFGTVYKVFADGRTEGFGPCARIHNRIPTIIASEVQQALAASGVIKIVELKRREVDHHGCI
jgi:hypothetical protein